MKKLKDDIKIWRKEVHNRDSLGLKELKIKVDSLDNKAGDGEINAQDNEERLASFKKICDIESCRIKDLKQKSKIKWAK